MADDERTGSCAICQSRDPLPELKPVCGPCRSRLAGQLRDIPQLCARLGAGPRPELARGEERIEEKAVHLLEVDGSLAAVVRVEHLHQVDVNAGAVAGQTSQPRVRGSREAPMPIRADAFDLLDVADEARMVSDYHQVPMVRSTGEKHWQVTWFDGKPVRQEVRIREVVSTPRASRCRCGHPELHERHRPVMVPAADQVGHVSVASVLNSWVRDWCETRREVGPEPVVPLLVRYLSDRLDWAFSSHGAVDEFAGEIEDVWHAVRTAAGLPMPREELCEGIPCANPLCDLKTLYRRPVSVFEQAEFVECASCSRLYKISEFDDWVRLVRAPLCGKRNGEWYCASPKKHEGDCEPYEREEATP